MINNSIIKFRFFMRSIIFLFFLFTGSVVFAGTYSLPPAASPIEGRWDVTVNIGGKESPSWFEVIKSGNHTLIGQYVALGGSARPISKVNFSDNKSLPNGNPETRILVLRLRYKAIFWQAQLLFQMVKAIAALLIALPHCFLNPLLPGVQLSGFSMAKI